MALGAATGCWGVAPFPYGVQLLLLPSATLSPDCAGHIATYDVWASRDEAAQLAAERAAHEVGCSQTKGGSMSGLAASYSQAGSASASSRCGKGCGARTLPADDPVLATSARFDDDVRSSSATPGTANEVKPTLFRGGALFSEAELALIREMMLAFNAAASLRTIAPA